jgi:hypothetical protein
MDTWEYKTENLGVKNSSALNYLEPILNEHGAEGWELVTLVPAADFNPNAALAFVGIFKRRSGA